MTSPLPRAAVALCMMSLVGAAACGGGTFQHGDEGLIQLPGDARSAGSGGVNVQWYRDLAPPFTGRYVPVERAGVAADVKHGRVYAGSSYGVLWTLGRNGKELSRYNIGEGIEAAPAVDVDKDRIWIPGSTGTIHALQASTGRQLWKLDLGQPISTPLSVSKDALYVITDSDRVVALNRETGDVLWRYEHESTSTNPLSIAGHAGLLLTDNRLLTATTDGVVVALDAGDGREIWHVDTSVDVLRAGDSGIFVDVDTTPVRVGNSVYIASFAAGIYELDFKHGVVLSRLSEYVGVTAIAAVTEGLILSSAEGGVVCLDLVSQRPRWVRKADNMRGVPGQAAVSNDKVFVAATQGALVVLALSDGHELARIESGHGYSTMPFLDGQQGYILSNTGRLVAFRY